MTTAVALPWYTEDCTVQRESDGFVITQNIPYSKILDSNLYDYIGKNEIAVGKKEFLEELGINTDAFANDFTRLAGEGKSLSFIAVNGSCAGLFAIADTIKKIDIDAPYDSRARIHKLDDDFVRQVKIMLSE